MIDELGLTLNSRSSELANESGSKPSIGSEMALFRRQGSLQIKLELFDSSGKANKARQGCL